MKHLQKTNEQRNKIVLIANMEKKGSYYFCNDMVYRAEYKHPLNAYMNPSLSLLVLLSLFFMMMAGRYGVGFFVFFDLLFVGLCALSLWLSNKRNRKLLIGAKKIDLRNMDEKTAYEIKWLAELGIVMRCSYAERMSGGALTLAVLSLICAAFGIGGTDLEEVWPVAIVLLEMWLYLKIFMQERARKRSVHRMMEFFNEYKANKSHREIDD